MPKMVFSTNYGRQKSSDQKKTVTHTVPLLELRVSKHHQQQTLTKPDNTKFLGRINSGQKGMHTKECCDCLLMTFVMSLFMLFLSFFVSRACFEYESSLTGFFVVGFKDVKEACCQWAYNIMLSCCRKIKGCQLFLLFHTEIIWLN